VVSEVGGGGTAAAFFFVGGEDEEVLGAGEGGVVEAVEVVVFGLVEWLESGAREVVGFEEFVERCVLFAGDGFK
jgi:hypothetical protein